MKRASKEAPTRALEQRRINTLYANNHMSHEDWSLLTDELSNTAIWTSKGRVK